MKNKKSLGQNWLTDREILETSAEFAFDMPENTEKSKIHLCLEIGPGLGTLTSSLLRRFEKVLAVEFDERLATNLPKSFPGKNLEVVNQDFLKFDLSAITEPYVVTGNIPYYITSPIIEKLLTTKNKPKKIVLLIQKEVAEKICPKESKLNNSSLSLFVDNYAKATLGPVVMREFFTPPPKVDSEVLILVPHKTPRFDSDILEFIHKSFANPRKKLSANLASFAVPSKTRLEQIMSGLNIKPNARPADLSLEEYAMLAKTLKTR